MNTLEHKADCNGTSLQGYVKASYRQLVDGLGEPHYRNGDKSTVEWSCRYDGIVFTIYDYKWKSCQNDTVEEFHVGGKDYRALTAIETLLGYAVTHASR